MPDEQRDFFTIIRYIDAPAAIEWLQSAFGFEKVLEIEGAGGTIDFAHLALEGDVIGTGTAMSEVRHVIACYVAEPEAHLERAKAAGAKIGREIEETEFGARMYLASDLAGNAWSFGTYRPLQKTRSVIFPASPIGMPAMRSAGLRMPSDWRSRRRSRSTARSSTRK